MKKVQQYLVDIILPFIVIFILCILLSVILYLVTNLSINYDFAIEPTGEKRLDGFIKITGTAISLTGFASIIITIIQSKKSISRELERTTIDLFKEFRNENFHNIRMKAWSVKLKWTDETYRNDLLDFIFSKTINEGQQSKDFREDSKIIFDLFEFYSVLSLYEGNFEIFRKLKYFYYGYWRSFLYSFASEIDERRIESVNKIIQFDSDYLENILMKPCLQRLDRICGFETICQDTEFHLDGG